MTSRPVAIILILAAINSGAVAAQYYLESPYLSRAGLEAFLDDLDPADTGRQAIIRTLYEDLLEQYEQRSHHARDSQRLDPRTDRTAWRSWQVQRRELEARFEADVLAVLESQQMEVWRGTMQGLRRKRVLDRMKDYDPVHRRIPDLLALLDEIELTDKEHDAVAEPAQSYADALDGVLRRWEMTIGEIMAGMSAAVNRPAAASPPGATSRPGSQRRRRNAWRPNLQEYNRLSKQLVAMVEQARGITDHSVDALAAPLTPSNRNRFLIAALAIKYPNVYVSSPVDALMDAVRADETVAPDQRDLLESVYGEYLAARQRVRRRTLKAIERWERPADVSRRRRRAERILEDGGDPGEIAQQHPVIEHLYERRELVKTTCRRMRSLLTVEELEALPIGARIVLSWHLR